MNVMKNRWSIKNSPHAVLTLDDLTRIKGPAKAELRRGSPLEFQRAGWAARPRRLPSISIHSERCHRYRVPSPSNAESQGFAAGAQIQAEWTVEVRAERHDLRVCNATRNL
jgi:hypothetical protein